MSACNLSCSGVTAPLLHWKPRGSATMHLLFIRPWLWPCAYGRPGEELWELGFGSFGRDFHLKTGVKASGRQSFRWYLFPAALDPYRLAGQAAVTCSSARFGFGATFVPVAVPTSGIALASRAAPCGTRQQVFGGRQQAVVRIDQNRDKNPEAVLSQ